MSIFFLRKMGWKKWVGKNGGLEKMGSGKKWEVEKMEGGKKWEVEKNGKNGEKKM
jgi:hypothetical protein